MVFFLSVSMPTFQHAAFHYFLSTRPNKCARVARTRLRAGRRLFKAMQDIAIATGPSIAEIPKTLSAMLLSFFDAHRPLALGAARRGFCACLTDTLLCYAFSQKCARGATRHYGRPARREFLPPRQILMIHIIVSTLIKQGVRYRLPRISLIRRVYADNILLDFQARCEPYNGLFSSSFTSATRGEAGGLPSSYFLISSAAHACHHRPERGARFCLIFATLLAAPSFSKASLASAI